ncbi:S-adenosyl-L-methionine-dependent methyltransferase [Aspergillus spinulosporus]
MAPKVLGQVPSLFHYVKPERWKGSYNHVYPWADGDCVEDPTITEAELHVLDLCCGQGRHTINLARRLPSVQFTGVDQSEFLISIAKKRAQEIQDAEEPRSCNTEFQVGDARQIPAEDGKYDLVILLGNSFGHGSYKGHLQMLRETGWEWLGPDIHFLSDPEAQLSADGRSLASREIVIDLQGPAVHQDLFYAVQLYDTNEMEGLLRRVGLCKHSYESMPITAPSRDSDSQSAGDMGMMEHRQLITVRVTAPVPAGTVIMADAPYALVPAVPAGSDDALICSNLLCRRRVPRDSATSVCCPNYCFQDVVWCDDHCKAAGQAHHEFECAWLRKHGSQIRQEEGEDELAMLWLIMRMLAATVEDTSPYLWSDRFTRGFQAIEVMRGNQEAWPDEKIAHWKGLTQRYLDDQLSGVADDEELLSLICKEESNSYGLYRGATGPPDSLQGQPRGAQYGLACYPGATMYNHSCVPNLKHEPDEQGRMVLTTARDMRQKITRELFTFSCTCKRCLQEAGV